MSGHPRRTTIASLECLEIPADNKEGQCLILIHGYGANCDDLFSLQRMIYSKPNTAWYFPNGPTSLGMFPGFDSRAWFPVDLVAFERAARNKDASLEDVYPAGMGDARQKLEQFIDSLGYPRSRIILGGFSQGAMLATDIALRSKENFAGLLIFSGNLLAKTKWAEFAKQKGASLKFFQSHGLQDPILGFDSAEHLYEILKANGAQGDFHAFRGGHTIPDELFIAVGEFLSKI